MCVIKPQHKLKEMKYSSLQLQELAWHKGSHSVTCCKAVVTSPPFPQQSWYLVKRPQRDARQSWASYTLRWYTVKMVTHTSTNRAHTHKHTHTRLTALCPGLSGWASTRNVKPTWILLKQETVSGSGISWAICKSASRSRQITTPAPHHSVFYRPDALPVAQPTVSKHWTGPNVG